MMQMRRYETNRFEADMSRIVSFRLVSVTSKGPGLLRVMRVGSIRFVSFQSHPSPRDSRVMRVGSFRFVSFQSHPKPGVSLGWCESDRFVSVTSKTLGFLRVMRVGSFRFVSFQSHPKPGDSRANYDSRDMFSLKDRKMQGVDSWSTSCLCKCPE
jgi:hypothetical protein